MQPTNLLHVSQTDLHSPELLSNSELETQDTPQAIARNVPACELKYWPCAE